MIVLVGLNALQGTSRCCFCCFFAGSTSNVGDRKSVFSSSRVQLLLVCNASLLMRVSLFASHQGVPAEFTEDACMYNVDVYGPDGVDNGAYPFGDKKVCICRMAYDRALMSLLCEFPGGVLYSRGRCLPIGARGRRGLLCI